MDIGELKKILQSSGVVGAGGAGFPTYAKINGRAKTIILNNAECEPLLDVSRQLLSRYTKEITAGLRLIADAAGAEEVIIAAKEDVEGLEGVKVRKLKNIYPVGDEITLVYEVLGVSVPAGSLPIDVGISVFSVETVLNVYYAVEKGLPVANKWLTITGAVENPGTVRVPIGVSVQDVLTLAGGLTVDNPAFITGGPMMGKQAALSDVITKTTNAVIVLPVEHSLFRSFNRNISIDLKRAASACCQCRVCTDMCPRYMHGYPIEPHRFMRAAVNQDFKDTSPVTNAAYCCGCGVCEMVACPQSLAPRALLKRAKEELSKAGFIAGKKEALSNPAREYRQVAKSRLTARLGLGVYDKRAPLSNAVCIFQRVTVPLKQHIGAGARAVVAVGDRIGENQMIGAFDEYALSVPVHSPIEGFVIEVTSEYITISKGAAK